jgi:nucleotide-binding universal stress UspA family protein
MANVAGWKTIVAGVDATPEGAWAAATAWRLAQATGATCALVHVVRDVWTPPTWTPVPRDVEPYRKAVLAAAKAHLTEVLEGGAPAECVGALELRIGRPALILEEVVRERGADLVVLGAKRHAALARWLGGSTARQAARLLQVPLLVATPSTARIKRVLAAVDLSDAAGATIEAAERFAKLTDAALRFVHVIEPPPYMPEVAGVVDVAGFDTLDADLLERSVWPRITLDRAERVVRRGPAAETIAAEASDWKADLLVMTSHGKGMFDRAVLGSVTERLLDELPASLLIVPCPPIPPAPR